MTADSVRLDKWLWAARFFKTRGLATTAVAGGKVHLNGTRAKPARPVQLGDELRIRIGPYDWLVTVRAITERTVRERLAEAHKIAPAPTYRGKGRPTKKDRRKLEEFL